MALHEPLHDAQCPAEAPKKIVEVDLVGDNNGARIVAEAEPADMLCKFHPNLPNCTRTTNGYVTGSSSSSSSGSSSWRSEESSSSSSVLYQPPLA